MAEPNLWLLVVFLLLFGLWDTGTTLMAHTAGLRLGGGFIREMNPVAREILQLGGRPFVAYKAGLSAMLVVILLCMWSQRYALRLFLGLANISLLCAVLSNVRVILILSRL